MGILIDLKEVCLDYRPGEMNALKFRLHALRVYNHIERCENLVVNPEKRVYNKIEKGDLAVINGEIL